MRWILIVMLITLLIKPVIAPVKPINYIYEEMLKYQEQHRIKQLKAKIDTADFTPELLYQALHIYVDNADIVYNQAKLESAWFKSKLFRWHNNPFGMKYPVTRPTTASYKARIGRIRNYAGYDHWSDAVEDMALWQGWHKERGKINEDYYKFLSNVGYAEAKNYIRILKRMEI